MEKVFNQQWIEGFKDEKNIQFKNQNYDQIRIDYYGYILKQTDKIIL